jgi:pyruvate/2-oxoglutarate dehydrogenase complex dihydrolipoamide acyltransferase (E2) component
MNGMKRSSWCVAYGTILCLAGTVPCSASEPLAQLLACRDLKDAAARLACFDREAAALAPAPTAAGAAPTAATITAPAAAPVTASPVSAAPAAPAPAHAAPVLDPQQQFGLPERTVAAQEVTAGLRAAEVSKIEARLVSVATGADGRAVFTLDNDQVWRELSPEGDLLGRPGDAVKVSRGVLRSYWLQLKSGRGCKVDRVR